MSIDHLQGLTSAEAAVRLAAVGPNAIEATRSRDLSRIVVETMREPVFMLLCGAALLYLFLGETGEGLFLFGGAMASIGLVIIQEARSERALAALRDLAQPLARVIRDGKDRIVAARDLVPGDILLVGEGERTPADGTLVSGDVLGVDEAMLTGESAPVSKQPAGESHATEVPAPGADGTPYVFAGTLIVRGQGVVRVTGTGARSAVGKIGASLAGIPHTLTPLQRTTGRLVGILGLVALAFCGVVAVAYGLVRADWTGGILAGITVAIALIPEEYPMVLAIFLALGARRLANHQVLVRRSAVIETLGAATMLCVDKTGTVTENIMRVAQIWTPAAAFDLDVNTSAPPQASEILEVARLASAVHPVDPMDRAVHALSKDMAVDGPRLTGEPERAWPLRSELLAVVQLWRLPNGDGLAAAKGAPEAVFRLCRLSEDEIEGLHVVIEEYAKRGLRVLGVASARSGADFTEDPHCLDFKLKGLVGFIDPVRPDVPGAIEEARAAGMKVTMITGDHPATALAIATSAGLETGAGVLLGPEIASLTAEELASRLKHVRVFARITPDQKLRIVQGFRALGELVAMTGDGVNDAPALEAAHIGIAMGRKGTDVAREAADLVLLDDRFASIVGGVRLGRRIFANLRRAMTYITAIHVPIAGLALLPILMGLPPLLFPMHVVLLELVIDPTCALVFETAPSERRSMERPPRRSNEALFGGAQAVYALLQGGAILGGVLGVYLWALSVVSEPQARALGFVALVAGNLLLAFWDSASSAQIFARHRVVFWIIAGAVTLVLAAVLSVPAFASLFRFETPAPGRLLIAIAVGAASGCSVGLLTLAWRALGAGAASRVHGPST